MLFNPFDSRSGHRIQARVGEGDGKILLAVSSVITDDVIAAQANRKIIVHRLVVKEIFLNHRAAVTQTKNKLPKAEVRIQFHYVPENRASANFDKWLGPVFSFLSQPRALSTAKNYYFQQTVSTGSGFALKSNRSILRDIALNSATHMVPNQNVIKLCFTPLAVLARHCRRVCSCSEFCGGFEQWRPSESTRSYTGPEFRLAGREDPQSENQAIDNALLKSIFQEPGSR
jgi:hypothetical protein